MANFHEPASYLGLLTQQEQLMGQCSQRDLQRDAEDELKQLEMDPSSTAQQLLQNTKQKNKTHQNVHQHRQHPKMQKTKKFNATELERFVSLLEQHSASTVHGSMQGNKETKLSRRTRMMGWLAIQREMAKISSTPRTISQLKKKKEKILGEAKKKAAKIQDNPAGPLQLNKLDERILRLQEEIPYDDIAELKSEEARHEGDEGIYPHYSGYGLYPLPRLEQSSLNLEGLGVSESTATKALKMQEESVDILKEILNEIKGLRQDMRGVVYGHSAESTPARSVTVPNGGLFRQ